MPAFIVHMLISRRVRDTLRRDPEMQGFVNDVLEKQANYMELGSLGPDLPYYGTARSLVDPNQPLGVDQWSYQLHAKEPNVFPLRMLEIIWKESDLTKSDWEPIDNHKLAFLFGFLTHVAADQTIHPLVDAIAGSYEKHKIARTRHRRCEVHQDLYFLAKSKAAALTAGDFETIRLDRWCRPTFPLQRQRLHVCPVEFTQLIQKAFVEAHAIKPLGWLTVERWIRGLLLILKKYARTSPYKEAYAHLFDGQGRLRLDSPEYKEYIALDTVRGKIPTKKPKNHYDDYLDEAVATACAYVKAAFTVIMKDRLDDATRKAFLEVVRAADLTAPLEDVNSADAGERVRHWDAMTKKFEDQQFLPG